MISVKSVFLEKGNCKMRSLAVFAMLLGLCCFGLGCAETTTSVEDAASSAADSAADAAQDAADAVGDAADSAVDAVGEAADAAADAASDAADNLTN